MTQSFVGIDVSKARLDIDSYPERSSYAMPNTADGIDDLVKKMLKLKPSIIYLKQPADSNCRRSLHSPKQVCRWSQ